MSLPLSRLLLLLAGLPISVAAGQTPDPGSYSPERYDCVVIVTAHSSIDYTDLVERAQVVVDLRNATGRNGTGNGKVWKL